MAYFGIACLLISALLTAIYMLTIVIRAFFPEKNFDYSVWDGVKDPNWKMMLPLTVFIIVMFVFGLYSSPIIAFFTKISQGLI